MKQSWIDRLEKKFGKYALQGFMKYIIAIQLVGVFIGLFAPQVYWTFLALDYSAIAKGQIWRLVTFLFFPSISSFGMMEVLFLAIELYLYYMIGNSLENVWGTFKFNLYYISGIVLSVLAGMIVYIFTGMNLWPVGFEYINQALFLAFATIFPNIEFLLFFVIPVKAKWLAIFYALFMGYDVLQYVSVAFNFEAPIHSRMLGLVYATAIVVSMLNYLIYYLNYKSGKRLSYAQRKRRKEFKQSTGPKVVPIYRHRCAICGRTEKDNENLEFRFCSKCDGNFEYCEEHIFTHEHVRRNPM